MNGILNVLKPPGMTSFDVVSYLRGMLRIKKIGHTGTLDPDAVGVLPICIGSATKAIEYMTDKDKLYRAELTLGVTTDTQDSSGNVLNLREVSVSPDQVESVLSEFVGEIKQIPPMYSAVKVDGKKLYELARKGITIEREPRDIKIYSINIVKNIKGTCLEDKNKVLMDVHCSKGTYIRTLCHDIGEKLGCGGHMSFLIRKRAGKFDINSALTLEEISLLHDNRTLDKHLLSPDLVFEDLQEILLNDLKMTKFMNGVHVEIDNVGLTEGNNVRVYNNLGRFVAIGEIVSSQNTLLLKSKKFF